MNAILINNQPIIYNEYKSFIFYQAQRSGEDTSKLKSLVTIKAHHQGASQGPFVQSEFVAATVAVLTWYYAYHARTKLQRN